MNIVISNSSDLPIYEQISSKIKENIMSGTLQSGDPIPSMRKLAKDLHVSVITVQKAYEELQKDGFIQTTVGRGSFVSTQNHDFIIEEKQRQMEELLGSAIRMAKESGVSLDQLKSLTDILYLEGED